MQRDTAKSKKIKGIAIPTILIVFYFLVPIPSWMGTDKIMSAITHHLFHANPFHLAANCFASWVLFSRKIGAKESVTAFVLASASWFCSTIPSIGFSNMLFAVMGLRTPSFNSPWWKSRNTTIFLLVMFGYVLVPGVSATTHIASFVGGCLIALLHRVEKQINSDYGKAKERRR